MINRRTVREVTLQALYAQKLSKEPLGQIIDTVVKDRLKENKDAKRFCEQLLFRTLENSEELDEIISSHIKNWNINRLAIIDYMVLKLALCEFLHFEDIPIKVTINEAIEIVKRYSTAKSSQFVNGILDAALEELKEKDKINKKGRGLINESTN